MLAGTNFSKISKELSIGNGNISKIANYRFGTKMLLNIAKINTR